VSWMLLCRSSTTLSALPPQVYGHPEARVDFDRPRSTW
jgi:hypothetical protein